MPIDARVFTAILIMGAVSVGIKIVELVQWHLNRKTLDEPVIDTATNGGVKVRG